MTQSFYVSYSGAIRADLKRLLQEATRLADRPTFEELSERISRSEPVNTTAEEIVQIIREARGPLPTP